MVWSQVGGFSVSHLSRGHNLTGSFCVSLHGLWILLVWALWKWMSLSCAVCSVKMLVWPCIENDPSQGPHTL